MTQPLTGGQLYKLPEFVALCNRIGVAHDLPTLGLVIEIGEDPDDLVKIRHTYQARPGYQPPTRRPAVETTNQHNEQWRTHMPPPADEPVVLLTQATGPGC